MKIGFIGAGKVGKAMGLHFKSHGLGVSGYYSRSAASAREAAELTGSQEFSAIDALAAASEILFITVPDQAFEEIDREAAALIKAGKIGPEKTWLHVSGAHPSDCLAGIRAAGGTAGSMHPLQSFGDPASSAARLGDAWFTIEGDEKAVADAKAILNKTGGKFNLIAAENKPLYHAGACVVSNYLVTLLESGIRFFEAAGMAREHIFEAIEPLISATLSNIREKGTVDALTGPIVRGDFNTIGIHLKAIESHLPSELDFYKIMGLKTVDMIDNKRLPHEKAEKFEHILGVTYHVK